MPEPTERTQRLKAKLKAIQAEKAQANLKSESQIQADFLKNFRTLYGDTLIFSIPNGVNAGKREKSKLKTQGLISGAPDLFIPEWRLFIEMKRDDGGKVDPKQQIMLDKLTGMGYHCVVAKGSEEALAACLAACLAASERQAKTDGGQES